MRVHAALFEDDGVGVPDVGVDLVQVHVQTVPQLGLDPVRVLPELLVLEEPIVVHGHDHQVLCCLDYGVDFLFL